MCAKGCAIHNALLNERRYIGVTEGRGMISLCWKLPQYY